MRKNGRTDYEANFAILRKCLKIRYVDVGQSYRVTIHTAMTSLSIFLKL